MWLAVRELGVPGSWSTVVRGRGYRLAQPLSLLDREAVLAGLAMTRLISA